MAYAQGEGGRSDFTLTDKGKVSKTQSKDASPFSKAQHDDNIESTTSKKDASPFATQKAQHDEIQLAGNIKGLSYDGIKLAEVDSNAPAPATSTQTTESNTAPAPSDTSTTTQLSEATTPKTPKAYKLDAVTVTTATGYTQDIKDAPASITIVPKEELTSPPYAI